MKKQLSFTRIIRHLSLIAIILLGSIPTTAFAVDIDFLDANNILFYGPGGGAKGCTYLPVVSTPLDVPVLKGKDSDERIWNFLIDPKQGLTKEQAAGIMGNIEHESSYSPTYEENPQSKDAGFGIMAWSFGRRTTLNGAAKDQAAQPSDLGFQLAFMVQEAQSRQMPNNSTGVGSDIGSSIGDTTGSSNIGANKTQWNALKETKSIEEATSLWYTYYENAKDGPIKDVTPQKQPSNQPGFINDNPGVNPLIDRLSKAKKVYEKFVNRKDSGEEPEESTDTKNNSSNPQNSGSTSGCSLADGNFQQTLLAYAWPEFHEDPYLDMKPAYEDAIKKRKEEGKYTGGYNGVDCGAFVTTLLVNSGFEPNYNENNGNVEGGQWPWLEDHWTLLGDGGGSDIRDSPSGDMSIGSGGNISTLDLKPGDVAIKKNKGHTFLYVGEIDGFNNVYASASLGQRAPMAAGPTESATNPNFMWYRKK